MTLQENLREEMKQALKNREELRLSVIRSLMSACTNELVAQKKKPTESLSDDEVLTLVKRAVKQRRDSVEQFKTGGRDDLAKKEAEELKILEAYLPAQMNRDDIKKIVLSKKEELGITDKSKMGILMGAVMAELKGKADGGDVKAVVEDILS